LRSNILPEDGLAYFFSDFFSQEESDLYFTNLLTEVEWKQEPIIIFGKKIMQPRLTAWYADSDKDYSYSGIVMHSTPWTETLLIIKEKIEVVSKVKFTGALLNLYRDEKDSMGWHKDDEKELGLNPVIGSVSFGAARTFKFQNIKDKNKQISIDLEHGSFLLMGGPTQHYWKHCIPKRTQPLGPRINITFRVII
jgi:alkylated DNA repair dioxygenase AlkB